MKAVVLEIRGGYAAVLKEDGTVERIRRKCRVGETIELEQGRVTPMVRRPVRWVAAAAAAVVLLSAGGAYGYNNAYAYSYVTLDVNPSIEYVLNRRDRVLSVEALNDGGEELAAALTERGVRGQKLSEAMDETLELLYAGEYLEDGNENCMLINVTSRGSGRGSELTARVEEYFSGHEDLEACVTGADMETARQAKALGLSAGRYVLMEEILTRETGEPAPEAPEDPAPFARATVEELLVRDGRLPAAEDRSRGEEAMASGTESSGEPEAAPVTEAPAEAPEGPGAFDGEAFAGERSSGPESPAGAASGEPSGEGAP